MEITLYDEYLNQIPNGLSLMTMHQAYNDGVWHNNSSGPHSDQHTDFYYDKDD